MRNLHCYAIQFDCDTALVFVEIQYFPQDFKNLGRLFLSLSLFVLLSPPFSLLVCSIVFQGWLVLSVYFI